ncbi:MAG: glycosyltransferase family 4 protein [Candidatus Acidiferrales bacterium]
MKRPLTIFVPHCSDMLTDHAPHGDGLVAHGFITHLAHRGHRVHVAVQEVDLREPLHPNVKIHQIHRERRGKVAWRMTYMRRVRRLFWQLKREVQFDLIHQLNPVFTGLSLALAGAGIPVVLGTYVARWPIEQAFGTARSPKGRAMAHGRDLVSALQQWHADSLVLTTPAAWNRLPNPRSLRGKAFYLPHGIDTELFSPATDSDPNPEGVDSRADGSILFFANVLERKGIFTLVEAFPRVLREFPAARLIVAGEGPALPEAKSRVTALGYADRVDFVGRQERSDATGLYRRCSIYCFPSFGEPYGTTLVEAMSCGRPVVVTDSGGPPHLVSDKGAILFPAGDAAALSRALCDLLRDPTRRAAMGRHNRRTAETTMSWDRVAEGLENIYEITLSRSRRGGTRGATPSAVSEAVIQAMYTSD